jgi:hypothetical protein
MTDDVKYLISVFIANRQKYGDKWRKIRRDRIQGLFSDKSQHEVEEIIEFAVTHGQLEPCIRNMDGIDYPALKLVKFVYGD